MVHGKNHDAKSAKIKSCDNANLKSKDTSNPGCKSLLEVSTMCIHHKVWLSFKCRLRKTRTETSNLVRIVITSSNFQLITDLSRRKTLLLGKLFHHLQYHCGKNTLTRREICPLQTYLPLFWSLLNRQIYLSYRISKLSFGTMIGHFQLSSFQCLFLCNIRVLSGDNSDIN